MSIAFSKCRSEEEHKFLLTLSVFAANPEHDDSNEFEYRGKEIVERRRQ